MNGSIFGGGMPPQGGGMFGQQQQSPLMQMMGGGGAGGINPQMMMQMLQQLLAAGGNEAQGQRGMPTPPAPPLPIGGFVPSYEGEGLVRSPSTPTFPEQYNAGPGRVPGTMDNMLQGMPQPPNPGVPGAFGGLPPEILRMLLAPRQI